MTTQHLELVHASMLSLPTSTTAHSAAEDIVAADFVFHARNDGPGNSGLERHKVCLTWHHGVAPDQQFRADDVVSDNGRAACRWTLHGTHQAEFLGVPSLAVRLTAAA